MDEYKLHAAIVQAINTVLEDQDEIIAMVTDAIRTAFHTGDGPADTVALNRQLEQLREDLDKLIARVGSDAATSEELDAEFHKNAAEQLRISDLLREQERERAAEEAEDSRLKAIIQVIRETPCALTEYDDMLVRRIVECVTVESKDRITVSFGYGVEVPVAVE